jgi:hypothetical protein
MTAPTTAAPYPGAAPAPAGLNAAQLAVWQRVNAPRTAPAVLPPLDPDYLAGEAYYRRLNRLNGDI